jgi:hypothetical protein
MLTTTTQNTSRAGTPFVFARLLVTSLEHDPGPRASFLCGRSGLVPFPFPPGRAAHRGKEAKTMTKKAKREDALILHRALQINAEKRKARAEKRAAKKSDIHFSDASAAQLGCELDCLEGK